MGKEKNSAQEEELEPTIRELQDQLKCLEVRIDFFIEPLLIDVCNKAAESCTDVPAIMNWLSSAFRFESDKTRKRFLKDLHDRLKKTLPMDPDSFFTLLEVVEEEPDLTIFER